MLAVTVPAGALEPDARSQTSSTDNNRNYVIHAGYLLAEPGKPVLRNKSVIIENGVIIAIKDGFVDGAAVIDLSRYYALPGLINLHTHVALPSFDDAATWPLERPTQVMLRSLPRLKAILNQGFTTIRDLGDESGIMYELAGATSTGLVEGPRIVASEPFFGIGKSYISAYGAGFKEELEPLLGNRGACINRDQCREAVREEVRRGAGVIKIRLSYLPLIDQRIESVETVEELKWIVDMAHQLHRTVAVHTVVGRSDLPVTNAIQAGADTIEHGPIAPDQIPLMKKMGTAYVPTLDTAKQMIVQYPALYPRIKAAVALTYKAGIKIGFGTDLPLVGIDKSYEEFLELHDAGMTSTDAIMTATVNAAEILQMSDKIGSIAPGKEADVIAVAADPTIELREFGNVQFVMKGGKIVKRIQ
jgi:imidazolonepropionase-like amidohydrolase